MQLSVHLLGNYLWLTNGQLVAFTAHLLHQDGKRQLATTLHLPGVRTLGGQNSHRDVTDQLSVQAVLHESRGHLGTLDPTSHWRCVDANGHGDCRFVNGDSRQRSDVVQIAE